MDNTFIGEIKQIQQELDFAHDTDPNYISPLIKELRNHIFQLHTSYEQSMELVIKSHYVKSNISIEATRPLFEQITFSGKLKIIRNLDPKFPVAQAESVNKLRNKFAHKKGAEIRSLVPDDSERLSSYRKLKEAFDELNSFWAAVSDNNGEK